MNYASIQNFGCSQKSPMTNPLSYCAVTELDSSFTHTLGQQYGPDSSQCQAFMASYCGTNWDGVCEYVSKDITRYAPNVVARCDTATGSCDGPGIGSSLTKGQILIRNAAAEKYLFAMSDNCYKVYEPFDPTVADSPLIGKWVSGGMTCSSGACSTGRNKCVPIYRVNPKEIDNDPIMNKILAQPAIAMDILVNIHNNAARSGEINSLRGTKLHNMFKQPFFQQIVQSRVL